MGIRYIETFVYTAQRPDNHICMPYVADTDTKGYIYISDSIMSHIARRAYLFRTEPRPPPLHDATHYHDEDDRAYDEGPDGHRNAARGRLLFFAAVPTSTLEAT